MKKNSLLVFQVQIRNHDWLSFQLPLQERDGL